MAREFFKNLPDTSTPLTAQRLNGILNGEEAMGSIVVGDIRGKNLFNKNIIVAGWLHFESNILMDDFTFTYVTSDYIEVKPNTTYTLNLYDADNLDSGGVMQYDTNKNWLGDGIAETQEIIKFTTKSDTKYVRFVLRNDVKDNVQLEEGETATTPAPFLTTIVESGKNDLGSWIKYSDGKMETTQKVAINNLAVTNQMGSMYYAFMNVPNFPQEFIETPHVTFGNTGYTNLLISNGEPISRFGVIKIMAFYPNNVTVNDGQSYVFINAKGYWK